MEKCDLLVSHGRHLLYRCTDAFKVLSAEVDGRNIPTGGVYGFLNTAIRTHARYGGTRVAVAWEGKGNFRLKLYPHYKGRDEVTDDARLEAARDMIAQEALLVELLQAVGVEQYKGKGCEADDVIGRLATEARTNGQTVYIYSGDSDLRQLVTDGIKTVSHTPKGDAVYDEAVVIARHGVPPSLIAELKAIAGDSSDRIPGARGIGPVTAATLLSHYGSLEAVLAAAENSVPDWPETQRRRAIIAAAADDIRMFAELTRVRTDKAWTRVAPARSQARVVEMMRDLRFRSLLAPAELHQIMNLGKASAI